MSFDINDPMFRGISAAIVAFINIPYVGGTILSYFLAILYALFRMPRLTSAIREHYQDTNKPVDENAMPRLMPSDAVLSRLRPICCIVVFFVMVFLTVRGQS